jgi:phosphoglucosamine mutase
MTRAKRLFGTDGIRSVAGTPPLDPSTVRRFGAALAEVLGHGPGGAPRLVLGRDTRESGPWLRDAVAAGLGSRRARVTDMGVVSTPGLAHVVLECGFDAGVMISASHNPFDDNGLKVFGADGTKLSDPLEAEVERLILDAGIADPGPADGAQDDPELVRRYVAHLERAVPPGRLAGLRLALDCANGSAAAIAPRVFRDLGAEVACLGCEPDGRNINRDCGSLHLDGLAAFVGEGGFDLGIGFDGDADRMLAVDRTGRVVDGDHVLYLAARHLRRKGALRGDVVVATVMSNLWLEHRLAAEGIRLERAPVGDKYVLERMLATEAVLGGEQSGHVIFRDHASTGDGILTGLLFLDGLLDEPQPLDRLLAAIEPYPQLLINVRVRAKPDLALHPVIGPALGEAETALRDTGRVLLRYSGTEPLARVMVEGSDPTLIRHHAERLVEIIRRELGA